MSPAICLIGNVDTVRVASTAQAKTGVVGDDLLVLRALSEVDFLFASLLPAPAPNEPCCSGTSTSLTNNEDEKNEVGCAVALYCYCQKPDEW